MAIEDYFLTRICLYIKDSSKKKKKKKENERKKERKIYIYIYIYIFATKQKDMTMYRRRQQCKNMTWIVFRHEKAILRV